MIMIIIFYLIIIIIKCLILNKINRSSFECHIKYKSNNFPLIMSIYINNINLLPKILILNEPNIRILLFTKRLINLLITVNSLLELFDSHFLRLAYKVRIVQFGFDNISTHQLFIITHYFQPN